MSKLSTEIPALVIALFLFAVLLRLDFVYYVIYVVGAIWLLSRWATPYSMRHLKVTRDYTDHIFLGETAEVRLELTNDTWLPLPWLRLDETLPLELAPTQQLRRVLPLRPKERATMTYMLRGARRGYYPIGPLSLMAGDLFGFAQTLGRDEGQQAITVYPRIIPLTRLSLPSRLPFGTLSSTHRIFEDPARLRGVREYQAGDSLRRINWKASAHEDALLVKQFSPAISLETMLLLNLNGKEYNRQLSYGASEWAIVVAASLASYLEGARQAVGLAANGRDPLIAEEAPVRTPGAIPPRPGRPHLMKVLEVLARVELQETEEPFAIWAQRAAVPLSWGTTVIAISPGGDEATCRGLHALVRAGLNVVLLVVEPYGQFGMIRERARRLGFMAHPVATEKDLDRLQIARQGAQGVGY